MAFPSSLDSFNNPTAGDPLNVPSHAGQHANANDAIEALEAKVGIDGSADADSLDYKVTNLISDTSNIDNTSDATKLAAMLLAAWPVGSIYSNKTDSTNPGTLFGGTWVAIEGYVVAGYKSGDANFGTPGGTVGVAEVTLTSAQSGLKAHTHAESVGNGALGGTALVAQANYTGGNFEVGNTTSNNTASDAASAHTNLQPTLVAYCWERTA
jgi:hypothetical protein